MSFTFDILDPGPISLLNNTCGTRCGKSHNFSYLINLSSFVVNMMILSGHIYPLSVTDFLLTSLGMYN